MVSEQLGIQPYNNIIIIIINFSKEDTGYKSFFTELLAPRIYSNGLAKL